MQLPANIDRDDFDTSYRQATSQWRFAIDQLCVTHGLAHEQVETFPDGSNLVASVDDRCVVKIFPPFHRHQWESERRVLPRLHGRLTVAVPALLAQGERDDGWKYVIVEKLPGTLLQTCWPEFEHADKLRVLAQIGAAMASVHAVPVGDLATLAPEWNRFVSAQAAGCQARHAGLGMPSWLLRSVDAWVGDGRAFHAPANERSILTGEYTPFNLLAQRDATGWQLSGMFDFGDAMIGPGDYDLLGPSVFLAEGNPALVDALLSGYFGRAQPLDEPRRMRLLGLLLLHRYASLDRQVRIHAWRERAHSLEELAHLIWPETTSD